MQSTREFTTQPNELIHENAKRIAESGMVDLTIRVPVIPTFNATPEEIYDIAMFAASLKGVKKLHLLPYHRLGQGKYDGLGREYKLDGIDLILTSICKNFLKLLKNRDLNVR